MADNEVVLFFVLVVDATGEESEVIQVEAQPGMSLAVLLGKMKSPANEPSELLKRISRRCNFYTLNDPFEYDDENPPDVRQVMASLQDENKYTHVGHNKTVKRIAQNFVGNYLYLIVVDVPDDTEMAIAKLKQNYANLYRCLLVSVEAALHWTRDDVLANGGSFIEGDTVEKPPEIQDLEIRLCEKRSFNTPDEDPELSIARRYSPQFESSYFRSTFSVDQANVKSPMEFIAFYVLLRCYHPDALRYRMATSSSLKAHALKSNFIILPFFSGRDSTDKLAYYEEIPWSFPMFVSCPTVGRLPRKYTPKSDFSIWLQELDLPLIIGELISQANEQLRYRMLLHAIALARLVVELRRPESTARPFIVAIYLTASLTAERYIVMKMEEVAPEKVYISQKKFDLTDRDAAVAFQREMYNLASELESVLTQLDRSKRDVLVAIKNEASKIESLHSSGAWSKRQSLTLNPIAEESHDSGLQDEDDLGIFADNTVRDALDEMNYKVAYVAYEHPNIALIVSCTDGRMAGCLKFVKDEGKELEILQYLAGLPSESNHTVRPLGIWPVTGGSVIAMPVAGNYLTSLHALDEHLWSLTTQLFEAVKFMHEHNVAHMDLKPSNLLIPSHYGRLTVIDFGHSFRLRNEAQLLEGHAGTEGYIAPEVGHTKFRPIRADLWSVGKVVQVLCMRCRPSPSRDWLLLVSKQLLDENPSKRPMMSEVLQGMANFDTVETLHDGH